MVFLKQDKYIIISQSNILRGIELSLNLFTMNTKTAQWWKITNEGEFKIGDNQGNSGLIKNYGCYKA